MRNSDHLAIKFTLAASLTFMIHIELVKQYQKLDVEKALKMAGNLFGRSQIKIIVYRLKWLTLSEAPSCIMVRVNRV